MPPFEDLRLLPPYEEIDAVPDQDPPDDEVEPVEPEIFPADPRYCVTVFYDPEVIRDDAAFHELRIRMEQEYGGREINMRKLDKDSLDYERLSPFPESEARFLRQGYVANVEGRIFDQGGISQSRYAKRNVAALTVNAMMMATFLNKQPIGGLNRRLNAKARWREVWKAMAPVMGKLTLHQDERDARVRAEVEAPENAAVDIEPQIFPLVEHEGLLLGTQAFRVARAIHWAYEMTPLSAWYAGQRDYECDALFGLHPTEIKNQIKFEAANVRHLFRPQLLDAEAHPAEVTPAMIATWYGQAIAGIRKVCWLVTAQEDPSLASHSLHREEAVHGFALGAPDRLPGSGRSWDDLIVDRTNELVARLIGPVVPGQVMTHTVSWDQEVLAGLIGATYDSHDEPGESPYSNPDIFTASLARWIGRLKRTRAATIDAWTADSILSFWRRSQEYEPLLLSQFPQATWRRLVEICEAMEADRDMPEVEVTYAWTQDRVQPFKCEERENMLALEGPLLCFPTLQAEYWQEKADIITDLEGFELA
ncbi:hypothetical protein [Bradyrhizobium genosp. A]|uniref:hypothetical protein n=1 Tax=Bradyrhizobium genosp. A TaxID=83626 RepID=UPI003CF5E3AB